MRLAGQIKQGGKLDEPTATLVALREGVDRVIAGSIEKNGDAYKLTVRLMNPTDNKTLLTWDTEAADKDAVLGAVGMAARVREGLGDTSADSDKVRDEESFTAASLEAAHAYTAARNCSGPASPTRRSPRKEGRRPGSEHGPRLRGPGRRRQAASGGGRTPRSTTSRRWRAPAA